ncbi:MAG: glycosyltransferase [Anaerolineae bacterium]
MTPCVSVNMSVYNGEQYVAEAVDSILNQTFSDFELIVVDDGSTDRTGEILGSYKAPRLHVLTQSNRGIPRSRNRALESSQGRYIAVMDSDDVSLPTRLERQVAFLEEHREIGVLGSACLVSDEVTGEDRELVLPLSDEKLRGHLIRGNPFVHSSVMMRKSVLQEVGGYNESFPYILDYELWVRLAAHTQFANLPEVLVIRRFHWGSVSTTKRTELLRLWLRMRVRFEAFRRLDYPWYYAVYILQPLLFTVAELRPKLATYLRGEADAKTTTPPRDFNG